MFNNIGEKIKSLAQITCWIGIVSFIIWGIAWWIEEKTFWIGLLIIVLGSILSWTSSFVMYGFGQLIENSDYTRDYLKNLVDKNNEPITIVHKETSSEMLSKTEASAKKEITHQWLCSSCRRMRSTSPCPYCGNE